MGWSEDLLHFIWKHRLFSQHNLECISGKKLQILKPGSHNTHAGPDFESAHLSIDNIDWFGNTEIHIRSSDWDRHKHQEDKAYNNVVLHVVFEHDVDIRREDGTAPETLVLKPYVNESVFPKYKEMMENIHWIPCEKLLPEVDSFYIQHWLSGVLIERLMKKSDEVHELLVLHQGDWEEVCYIIAARSFGFKTNSDAFERLAKSLPYKLIAKNAEHKTNIEALLFGQSGLLHTIKEGEYPLLLKREYGYMQKAYALKRMEAFEWKFLRMRPAGFPSMRIAQFSAFCFSSNHLFSKIIELENVALYKEWLSDLPVHDFWKSHYHFANETATAHGNQLGNQAINSILLNTIVVILFSYGQYIGNESYIQRAITLLESLPSDENSVIGRYRSLGIKSTTAAQSQALLHLKRMYCDKKQCLNCEIGLQIIKKV